MTNQELAEKVVDLANEKLNEGGWNSYVHLNDVFEDAEGNTHMEVIIGEGYYGENEIYAINQDTDIEELAEEIKESAAFIEGDEDEDYDDNYDEDGYDYDD